MAVETSISSIRSTGIVIPKENPALLEDLKPFSRFNIREFVMAQSRALPFVGCEGVLDVGCGYRTNEPEVMRAFEGTQARPFYIAFDHTAKFDKPVDPTARLTLVAAATQMPFQDRMFDAVFCTEVLEHAYSDEGILGEIARVMSNGGKLILTVPGRDIPLHEKLPHQFDYRRYDQTGLKLLLNEFGFEDVTVRSCLHNGLEINLLASAVKAS